MVDVRQRHLQHFTGQLVCDAVRGDANKLALFSAMDVTETTVEDRTRTSRKQPRLGLRLIGAPDVLKFLASLLVALLIGFEASSIRRRKLAWKKWQMLGFVVGEDAEEAEQRFVAEWMKSKSEAPTQPAGPPELE